MPFVQLATGKQHEHHLEAAQSSVNNARKNSLQAAFNLFVTSLQNDQVLHDKHMAAAAMHSQRTRSIVIHSLEDLFLSRLNLIVSKLFGIKVTRKI